MAKSVPSAEKGSVHRSRSRKIALKAAILYGIVGGTYILISSIILSHVSVQPKFVVQIEVIKGLLFILITAALLYVLMHRYLTQIFLAEAELAQSEEKFRLLVENTSDWIWEADQNGAFTYSSPTITTLLGYQPQEIIGASIYEIIASGDKNISEQLRQLQTESEHFINIESFSNLKTGGKKYLETRTTAIRDNGNLKGYRGISRDFNDRKNYEKQLLQVQYNLENKSKELETIVGIVSHDLRGPLLNVRGFNAIIKSNCEILLNLIASADLDDAAKKNFEDIINQNLVESTHFIDASADAMNRLAESLVKVARAGLVVPKPEVLDMANMLKGIVASIQIKFKKAGIRFDLKNLPPCYADKTHVMQIFTNLLDNAVKYMDPSRAGEICVQGAIDRDLALYWVSDNGIGMSPDEEGKIFDLFYQIKGKAPGEGIGLATAKRMIERNNGRIWVLTEKGVGSNFFVGLPLPEPKQPRI